MLRRYITHNSGVHDLGRIYVLFRIVAAGAPGHRPIHLLWSIAAIGFAWLPDSCIWQRPGLPALLSAFQCFSILQRCYLERLDEQVFW